MERTRSSAYTPCISPYTCARDIHSPFQLILLFPWRTDKRERKAFGPSFLPDRSPGEKRRESWDRKGKGVGMGGREGKGRTREAARRGDVTQTHRPSWPG